LIPISPRLPSGIKAGALLPFGLKYNLDGVVLALRRTRRAASAKTVLGALIWRYVDPQDIADMAELLLEHDEVSRPTPTPMPRTAIVCVLGASRGSVKGTGLDCAAQVARG
jgi:hypothetical protein